MVSQAAAKPKRPKASEPKAKPAKRSKVPASKAKPRRRRTTPSAAPERKSLLTAVDAWLRSMELDELGEARATLSRTLAQKLDELLLDDAVGAAMAIPGTSRELREMLDALQEASDDAQEFVADLFSEVGDSAKS
jgi:hypothetical protein